MDRGDTHGDNTADFHYRRDSGAGIYKRSSTNHGGVGGADTVPDASPESQEILPCPGGTVYSEETILTCCASFLTVNSGQFTVPPGLSSCPSLPRQARYKSVYRERAIENAESAILIVSLSAHINIAFTPLYHIPLSLDGRGQGEGELNGGRLREKGRVKYIKLLPFLRALQNNCAQDYIN